MGCSYGLQGFEVSIMGDWGPVLRVSEGKMGAVLGVDLRNLGFRVPRV